MLPNKAKALHLVRQGFQVIPVTVKPDGSNDYNFKWSEYIINSELTVDTYWHNENDRLVAFIHPTIGVIDIDVKNGKNGFEFLEDNGLALPDTYNYETKSGGRHYLVRFPEGSVKHQPFGDVGIDVQVSNGLAVWYGEVISDEELANIADAPAWALKGKPEVAKKKDFNPIDWFDNLPEGDFSDGVQKVLSRIPDEIDHTAIIKLQFALIAEAAKGGVGVRKALDLLKSAYLRDEYNTPEYEKEWNDGLKNLVLEDAEALVEQAENEDKFEDDVAKAVYREEVSRAAKRRVREKNYSGTISWDWEDLQNLKVEYTVQSLLYTDSQNGLVGRSQLGKTHLLVSLICHMALGKRWFDDIAVKQQRVLFIAGEGKSGIVQRFNDWCNAFGYTMDDIKEFVKIVTDVDLSLEVSLEQLQVIANDFKPDVVIMDTLSATTSMENENDATDMAEALANGRAIYPGSIVLWVHHPSEATRFQKDPKPRGSSVFKSNLDNMMTITVDDKFQPLKEMDKYTNGNEVRFLSLSTDDEEHGGKSKEGAPVTIRGLYLWEFERGHVVMAQTEGESTHPDNVVIKKVYDHHGSETISAKDFWAKADELGLKDSDDLTGGWRNQKSAERMLQKAEGRGLLNSVPGKGTVPTMWTRIDFSKMTFGGGF